MHQKEDWREGGRGVQVDGGRSGREEVKEAVGSAGKSARFINPRRMDILPDSLPLKQMILDQGDMLIMGWCCQQTNFLPA